MLRWFQKGSSPTRMHKTCLGATSWQSATPRRVSRPPTPSCKPTRRRRPRRSPPSRHRNGRSRIRRGRSKRGLWALTTAQTDTSIEVRLTCSDTRRGNPQWPLLSPRSSRPMVADGAVSLRLVDKFRSRCSPDAILPIVFCGIVFLSVRHQCLSELDITQNGTGQFRACHIGILKVGP